MAFTVGVLERSSRGANTEPKVTPESENNHRQRACNLRISLLFRPHVPESSPLLRSRSKSLGGRVITHGKVAPLVAHVIYRLGIGGLENGLVNLINRTPTDRYRHTIICLKDATDFRNRIRRGDVAIYELGMQEGRDFTVFAKLYRLLRALKPNIVHTRNLAAIECQLPTFFAGVKHRVHGEHGWDVFDPDGSNRKYQFLRRLFKPLVHRYIPLSAQLERYLRESIRVPGNKIRRISNGVDTDTFHPARKDRQNPRALPFDTAGKVILGTIGRMHGVKDQTTLVDAFIRLLQKRPELRDLLRLVIVGDGPLRSQACSLLASSGFERNAWLPGERNDVPDILRALDLFVLPSTAEGLSNTVLEAMATGLPVIATDVGGNPDLVTPGVTGTLIPCSDPDALSRAIEQYLDNDELATTQGANGLRRVREKFSLDRMVEAYLALYDELLA